MDKPTAAYEGRERYAFVSYAHADQAFVYPEMRWLQDQGFRLWYDAGISGAARWRDAIAGRIAACELFVLYVSAHSASSQVCREELEYALDQGKAILAIHTEEVALPEGMRLGITNRQALMRHRLTDDEYQARLAAVLSEHLGMTPGQSAAPLRVLRPAARPGATVVTMALLCGLIIGAGAALLLTRDADSAADAGPLEYTIELPRGVVGGLHDVATISRDGDLIVWPQFEQDQSTNFRLRRSASRSEQRLDGPDNVIWTLSLSPDARWLAFYEGGAVYRMPTDGGSAVRVAELPQRGGIFGVAWLDDETLVYPDSDGLMAVPRDGGTPRVLVPIAYGDGSYLVQPFSIDARVMLYTEIDWRGNPSISAIAIEEGEAAGTPVDVLSDASQAHVTEDGLLVFVRDRSIWAVAFDADRMAIDGTPVRVLDDVHVFPAGSGSIPVAAFDLSIEGTLVYQPASTTSLLLRPSVPVILDRRGEATTLPVEARGYRNFEVSPDGCCFLTRFIADGQPDIWIYRLDRGTWTRVTSTSLPEPYPTWSPDGEELFFSALVRAAEGVQPPNLHRVSIRGDQSAVQVTSETGAVFVHDWVSPGTALAYAFSGGSDMFGEVLLDDGSFRPLLEARDGAQAFQISPDRRWVAYQAAPTGRPEIYVRPYPEVDRALITVSTNGGISPRWHPDGGELFYLESDERTDATLMSVPFDDGELGTPGPLTRLEDFAAMAGYDVLPGGNHFLFGRRVPIDDLPDDQLVVVRGFAADVRDRLLEAQ